MNKVELWERWLRKMEELKKKGIRVGWKVIITEGGNVFLEE